MTDNRALKLRARLSSKISGDKYVTALDKLHSRQQQVTLQNSFSDADAELLKSFIYFPLQNLSRQRVRPGSIIFTGLTGTGKTTAMAAVLEDIVQSHISAVIIEDYPEVAKIVQLEKNLRALSLRSSSLKSQHDGQPPMDQKQMLHAVVRMMQDSIVLGEVRDADIMKDFFRLSQAGFQLMTTMHIDGFTHMTMRMHENETLTGLSGIVQSKRIHVDDFGSYFLNAVVPLDREAVQLIQEGSEPQVEAYLESQGVVTVRAKVRSLVQRGILVAASTDASDGTVFRSGV